MTVPDTPRSGPHTGVVDLVRLGLAFGLVVGTVEGLGVSGLLLVPGALSWRTANDVDILSVAPLVDGLLFAAIGLVLGLVARVASRRVAWDTVLVVIGGALAGYLAARMPGPVLAWWTVLLVSLGVAAVARRVYRAWGSLVWRRLSLISLVLLIQPVATFTGLRVGRAWRERVRLGRLPPAPAGRPNVLLLVIDTQRADHLGLYGYGRPTTPNLDRLASRSLVYDRAVSASSWTLPSHASLLTGRPVDSHHAGVMRRPYLGPGLPTVAEELDRDGYATGGFVANTFWTGRVTGLARGFVHYEDYYRNLADAVARTTIGRLLTYGVLPRFGMVDVPGRRRAPAVNRALLHWIDGLGGRPFFAFVNYFDVHAPVLPEPPYRDRFETGALPAASQSDGVDIGQITGDIHLPSPAELQRDIDRYDEAILGLDAALGGLFDQLRERGLFDNTLIIVTGDHGESYGEHGLLAHGHSLFAEQVDVPLILSWPARIPEGVRRPGPVANERVAATVVDAVGLSPGRFPGPSLLAAGAAAAPVVIELPRRSTVPFNWPSSEGWVAGLATPDWWLLEQRNGVVHLFDARQDPRQLHDLAELPAYRALRDSLVQVLARHASFAGLRPDAR